MKEKEKKETKVNKEEKEKVSLFKKIFKKDSKKDIINSAKKEAHEKALKEEIIIKNDFQKDIQFDEDAYVSLRHIDKIYDNKVQAVFDFNLDIQKQEFIVLVGPSGCGKSTTLRMIAGLEEISNGELYIDHVLSNDLAPKNRNIAMVFQNYALYPHMTVYDNLAFGLKMTHVPKDEIVERVLNAAKILGLEELLDRKPKALSGGQRQRVALGRAIVRNSRLFLMDEPLSNLDAKLRVMMRSEIVRIHEQIGATTIYVTHDQTEAMTMATKIVVMSKGWVQQVGTPKEVYSKPNNLFVAKFIGSPAMNIFDGTYNDGTITLDDGFKVDFGEKLILAHKKFYTKKIEETERLLSLLDTDIEGEVTRTELAKIFSAKSYAKNEKEAKDIDVLTYSKKKKKKIFAKKAVKGFDLEETRSNLNEMLAKYKEAFTSSHTIKLGIRPENIHVASTYKEKDKSASFVIEPNVVELLGGEYLLHSTYNGIEMIAKVPATLEVKAHEQIKLVMSKNLIHIFDEISGERIDLDE